jgi:tetratricopeptide (TPR) repeat protein
MSLNRVVVLGLAGAVIAGPLAAQGIPRRATISPQRTTATTRLMVANPYPTAAADSALAVRVGNGLRSRMERAAGNSFSVIADTTMNRALTQFGYPADALLTPLLQRTLAQSITARYAVTGTVARTQNGHQLTARVVGTGASDEAGHVVTVPGQPNESPADFGQRAADAIAPALKAMPDARQCMDQRTQNPGKATSSAEKALKAVPNHGLAAYCLALIQIDRKAPVAQQEQYLNMAVKGDPQSLAALGQLAKIYETAKDTAKLAVTYRNILLAAPQNQQLREQIFRYFITNNHPNAAREIADEGIRQDPNNTELYDLKANACLFQSDFRCATQALEQAWQVDSTRADTLFFAKINVAAEQRLSDSMPVPTAQDTATFVRWAMTGANRFPNNLTLLQAKLRAFSYVGQVDSSLALTQRIMQVDSTSVTPAIAAVQALITADRFPEAKPFIDRVKQRGQPEDKERMALVFLAGAQPRLQEPNQNFALAADLSREAVALLPPNHARYHVANLLLGFGAFFQAATMDEQVAKGKRCQDARQEQALILEAEKAFNIAKTNPAHADASNKQLTNVNKFKPRAAALVKAFCR